MDFWRFLLRGADVASVAEVVDGSKFAWTTGGMVANFALPYGGAG
jgi:hypothetical protein